MPVRIMALFKAMHGMSRAQLIERYEGEYVPLVSRMLPFVLSHRRHYVTDDRSPALVAAGSPFLENGFDVIAEWTLGNDGEATDIAETPGPTVQPGQDRLQ